MTQTIGRIDRTGTISFHDASIHIWEDGISAARDAGGFKGDQEWERAFNRDVKRRMAQNLRKLGWSTEPMNYIFNGNGNLYCRKGDLRGDLIASGRTVKFEMFQNVNAPKRPDHGGRYEYDKEALMPYTMRLEMERTRRAIRQYLLNVFTGYSFKDPEVKRGAHAGGLTAVQWVEQNYRGSYHFNKALGHPGGSEYTYNHVSADKVRLVHGQRVWYFDRNGRIAEGIAMYNINSMWWVVTGRYTVDNLSAHELHTKCPENFRLKRNADRRRKRLEAEMAKAVSAMQFERAGVLRDVLFPGRPELYNVWHAEHNLYHCAGFSGYTADQSKAGKFTAAEVRGWDYAPNKVRAIEHGVTA